MARVSAVIMIMISWGERGLPRRPPRIPILYIREGERGSAKATQNSKKGPRLSFKAGWTATNMFEANYVCSFYV